MSKKKASRSPIPSKRYTYDYFLANCNGYKQYNSTHGKSLNNRLRRVMDIAGLRKGMTILDLGCGRGELAYHSLKKGCRVYAVDYSSAAISLTKKTVAQLPKKYRDNLTIIQQDAKKLNFPTGIFDVIIATDMIEHLHDWELLRVFDKCSQFLKDNGKLIINTTPNKLFILYMYPLLRLFTLFIGHDIGALRKNYPDEKEHVNELTPMHLKRLLRKWFTTKIWCENLNHATVVNKIPILNNFAVSIFSVAVKR